MFCVGEKNRLQLQLCCLIDVFVNYKMWIQASTFNLFMQLIKLIRLNNATQKYLLKWDFTLGLIALALSVDTQLVYFAGLQYLRRRRQKKMAAAG